MNIYNKYTKIYKYTVKTTTITTINNYSYNCTSLYIIIYNFSVISFGLRCAEWLQEWKVLLLFSNKDYKVFLSCQLLKQSRCGKKQRATLHAEQMTGVFLWHDLHFLLEARLDCAMCFGLWCAEWWEAGAADEAADGIQSASSQARASWNSLWFFALLFCSAASCWWIMNEFTTAMSKKWKKKVWYHFLVFRSTV